MVKKIIHTTSYILGSLTAIVLLLVLLIHYGYLNSFIAQLISSQASQQINGQLKIEKLEGSVFSDFMLGDISLLNEKDTLFYCQELSVEYQLKELILDKKLILNQINTQHIRLNLIQEEDSSFNISHVFQSDSKDTVSSGNTIPILLKDIQLKDIQLHVSKLDQNANIPKRLKFGAKANGYYTGDSALFSLDSLQLESQSPHLLITQLSGTVRKDKDLLKWKDVYLKLENTIAQTQGYIETNQIQTLNIEGSISPLDLNDVKAFLPGIEFNAQPNVRLSISGDLKAYLFHMQIDEAEQMVVLDGTIKDIQESADYALTCLVKNIDNEPWLKNKILSAPLTGQLNLKGSGLNFKEGSFNAFGSFKLIRIGNYSFKNLKINSSKQNDIFQGNLSSQTSVGDIDLNYHISELFAQPHYKLFTRYQNLNLQHIVGIDSIYTNLNGSLSITGTGNTLKNINTDIVFNSNNSTILNHPIDDFLFKANYNKGDYQFSDLQFDTPYFYLKAQGNGNLFSSNNIHLEFEPKNLNPLLREFALSSLSVQGNALVDLFGSLDSLKSTAKLHFNNINYDSIYIGNINADLVLQKSKSQYNGEVDLQAQNISYQSYDLNALDITSHFSHKLINSRIQLQVNDSLSTILKTQIEGFTDPLVRIHQLDIHHKQSHWSTKSDSAYVALKKNQIFIKYFNLESENQKIDIHGLYSFDGDENIKLSIENLQLQDLPLRKYIPYSISGKLNTSLELKGTAQHPVISNSTNIEKLDINNYQINKLESHVNYSNNLLSLTSNVFSLIEQPININLLLPIQISFIDSTYLFQDSQAFSASLKLDSLNLKRLSSLYPISDIGISGVVSADMVLSNTIQKPFVNGKLGLSNGTLSYIPFGANYRNIQLHAAISNNLVSLQNFSAQTQKKGVLSMKGQLNLNSDSLLNSEDFNFSLDASNFQALKSDKADLNLNADVHITGINNKPHLKGELIVNRSRINADYFNTFLSQKIDDPNPPLLEEILQKETIHTIKMDTVRGESPMLSSLLYKNLGAELTLKIPSNTWIRGKDMNFELNGSLLAIKNGDNIDLFGNLKVRKGFYKLYGKYFSIKNGELNFTGGTEINPYLDFTVAYKFNDIEKELRVLQIQITERMHQPQMTFQLDEEEISEKDAIAYIVFGKSANQLSDSQKSKVFNSEEFALNMTLNQLSSIVRESLIKSTGLDVVEISGEDKWKSSSVTIGKYITNKFYLSYEKSYVFDKKTKAVNTEKMMLEYQIIRNLILKATNQNSNSGFDLMIKKNWK